MSPLRFPRVQVSNKDQNGTKGFMTHMMPQSDGSYLYEVMGDDGKTYLLKEGEFLDIGDNDESER
jgi:hypothetical protein